MEDTWLTKIESLIERLESFDPELSRLEPFPSPELEAVPTANLASAFENRNHGSWNASSLFHMMILLEDPQIQNALDRLWETCGHFGATNGNVHQVILPAAWPSREIKRALASVGHFRALRELRVVTENHREDDDANLEVDDLSRLGRSPLGGWHATAMELATNVFPFLRSITETPLDAVPSWHPCLVRLSIDCRLTVHSQDELDRLGGYLSYLKQLESISLFLASSQTAEDDEPLSMDPVLEALVEVTRAQARVDRPASLEDDSSRTGSGLQSVSLRWCTQRRSQQSLVSERMLSRFLVGDSDEEATSLQLKYLHLTGLFLGDAHVAVVAKALRRDTSIRNLKLCGHKARDGGVTAASLESILDALEHYNTTLLHAVVFCGEDESSVRRRSQFSAFSTQSLLAQGLPNMQNADHQQGFTNALASLPSFPIPFQRSCFPDAPYGDQEDYSRCCRIQEQIRLYCRLNRLGRGRLLSEQATGEDWVQAFVKCRRRDDGSAPKRFVPPRHSNPFSVFDFSDEEQRYYRKKQESLEGLDELYLLLKHKPSLCYDGGRSEASLDVPIELQQPREECPFDVTQFKDFRPPSTSVSKVLAMDWQNKRRRQGEERSQAASVAAVSDDDEQD